MRYSTRVVLQIEDEIGKFTVLEKDERDWDGPVALCCGPSGAEEGVAAQQGSLASTLAGDFNTQFADQQGTLSQLQSRINQIGNTGPGFSGAEDAARTSQIVNQGAADAAHTTQAVQDRGAGQVFGGEGDSSGLARTSAINKQIGEQAASASAARTANALTDLKAQDYAQGRANNAAAINAWDVLAGRQNPLGYGEAAGQNFGTAFGEQDKINQENNAAQADALGLITGAAKAGLGLATGGITNLFGIGSKPSSGSNSDSDGYYD
jgi:hypothetical protein